MNISSILVQTRPDNSSGIQKKLADIPGVDVHGATSDGHIIITIEDTPGHMPSDTLMNVQNMMGVMSAAIVYNYSDENLASKQ